MAWSFRTEAVLGSPFGIKVGFDPEALAFEGSHIIGFSSVLLMLIAPQVHLPPQLLHPDVGLPPSRKISKVYTVRRYDGSLCTQQQPKTAHLESTLQTAGLTVSLQCSLLVSTNQWNTHLWVTLLYPLQSTHWPTH